VRWNDPLDQAPPLATAASRRISALPLTLPPLEADIAGYLLEFVVTDQGSRSIEFDRPRLEVGLQ
jgi:hypothetical protein